MRGAVLLAMIVVVLAACGEDRPDVARPTTLPPPTFSPTMSTDAPAPTVADAATEPTTPPIATTTTTTIEVAESSPSPSGDGLSDSIMVTDKVSIVVLDPED